MSAAVPVLAAVLEHSRELLALSDDRGRLLWATEPLRSLVLARGIDLVHPDDRRRVAATYRAVAADPQRTATLRCRVAGPGGGWRDAELRLTDRCGDPAVGGWITTVVAAGEGHAETAELRHRADHDGLTGLANRDALLRQLSGGPMAVLFTDLDGFKAVNDDLGHAAGDRLLVVVADRLRRAVRPGDLVARLGGDEFVVLAAGVEDEAVALEIAQRVRAAVSAPVALGGRQARVSASVGIALGDAAVGLLDKADIAMYRAKRSGRDRLEFHRPGMAGSDGARDEAAQLVREALEGGGLEVAHQPVVDLATGEVVARAASLRLGESGTAGGASRFVDLAERSGLIVSIGAGLLDTACADGARWPSSGRVWVPLSPRQLDDPRLAGMVRATLGAHRLDPRRLLVQVTERDLAAAGPTAWANLTALADAGVGLGVTGYGSGGASLSHLHRARIDVLGIDPAFVGGLGRDEGDSEVVRAFVCVGAALRLTTVAFGVERPDQAAALRAFGCDLAVGAHVGRPWGAEGGPTRAVGSGLRDRPARTTARDLPAPPAAPVRRAG